MFTQSRTKDYRKDEGEIPMNYKESTLYLDKTAQLQIWEDRPGRKGYWVTGDGWETKVTYSEERAWELAYAQVAE